MAAVGVSLHVRTCTPRFYISGTTWSIVFKFGVWVRGHKLRAFHKSMVGFLCTCTPHLFILGADLPIALKFDLWQEAQ